MKRTALAAIVLLAAASTLNGSNPRGNLKLDDGVYRRAIPREHALKCDPSSFYFNFREWRKTHHCD